jgi:PadR family transcriptional regulator PadR
MGEKKYLPGNTPMIILKVLHDREMYGWEIINELAKRSSDTLRFKAGVLYPILHSLENDGHIISDNRTIENGRARIYYRITDRGREHMLKKQAEWENYVQAINDIMKKGVNYAVT